MNERDGFRIETVDLALSHRLDPRWIEAQSESASSRVLPVRGGEILVEEGARLRLGWLPVAAREIRTDGTEPILLGVCGEVALFATDVSGLVDPADALGLDSRLRFRRLDAAALRLPEPESAVAIRARALVEWHASHRFCPACGAVTAPSRGGAARECGGCRAEHVPHVDPAIVVLIEDGGHCLLGRRDDWPAGVYSAFTTFVEPGESLERAVRREVLERSGLEALAVRYRRSQPWADPPSLLVGCTAEVSRGVERPGWETSMGARWFPRGEVLHALRNDPRDASALLLPPPLSAAHELILGWAEECAPDL